MLPVHPGRILKLELDAGELPANRLAPPVRPHHKRSHRRGISPETALWLGRCFGNCARFWPNLQTNFERAVAERKIGERIMAEVAPDAAR